LNWLKIHDRIHYKKAILVYKSLNNLLLHYMSDLFSHTNHTTHRLHTQQTLNIPKPRLEFCRKALAYSGKLPLHIRQSNSLAQLKHT
jgi:hypothetical protein